MATMSEIMVKLNLDMKDFNTKMKSVGSQTSKLGNNMKSVGKTMTTAMAVPMGLMGGAVIKFGSDYEATMSKVQAMTGANGKEMDKLGGTAKKLGETTKYSASEVAEGMSFLGMAGFKTNDIIKSMPGLLNLATAGGLDLAKASDIASNILTGFGMSAGEAGHMADVLAYASSNSNTNVEQLGDAMKYLAPTAKSLGWGLEDATSAVMALSDAGIQGEMAGSTFATSLTRLSKPTKEMDKVMSELGLTFFDAQGNMKSLPTILSDMEKATGGLTQEQKASALSTLFGMEAYKSWSVLLDAGSEKVDKNARALENADGKAKQMADTMANNLKGKTDSLKSSLEAVAISIYEQFAPAIGSIVDKATEAVRWFNSLSDGTKKTLVTIGLFGAGISVAVLVLGTMVSMLGSVITGIGAIIPVVTSVISVMSKMRTAMNLASLLPMITSPVGLIVLAIGTIIAIGILVWQNWDTIKAKAIEIWGYISTWLKSTWDSVKSVATSVWGGIKDFFTSTWDAIKSKVTSVWTSITSWLSSTWESMKSTATSFLTSFKQFFTDAWQSIKDKTTSVFNAIVSFIVSWAGKLLTSTPIGLFVQFIAQNWDTIKQTTSIVFDMIKALIKLAFVTIKSIVTPIVTGLKTAITTAWNGIKTVTSTVFGWVKSFLTTIWNGIKSVVVAVATALGSKIKSVWSTIKSTTSTVFNAVKSVMSSVWNGIKSLVVPIVTAIGSKVTSIWNKIKSTTSSVFNSVKSVASSVWNSIKSTITSVVGGIYSSVKGKFDSIKSTVSSIFNSIKSTASSVWGSIKSTIVNFASTIYSSVKSKFDSVKSSATSIWNSIKSTITNVASSIVSSVQSKFADIKSKMVSPIESAKNTISGIVQKIKGFFSGMKLTIPKPTLPHISVSKGSKSVGGVSIPYPKFSVSMHAKGGIFSGSTLLGGGTDMVGEAGAEAVLPLSHKRYMKPFTSTIASQLKDMEDGSDGGNVVNNFNVSELVVREEADIDRIAQKLYAMQTRSKRQGGR